MNLEVFGKDSPRWPEPISNYVLKRHGHPTSVSKLHGVSRARVWHVTCPGSSCVVKSTAHPRELEFYQEAAPLLRMEGVPIPKR